MKSKRIRIALIVLTAILSTFAVWSFGSGVSFLLRSGEPVWAAEFPSLLSVLFGLAGNVFALIAAINYQNRARKLFAVTLILNIAGFCALSTIPLFLELPLKEAMMKSFLVSVLRYGVQILFFVFFLLYFLGAVRDRISGPVVVCVYAVFALANSVSVLFLDNLPPNIAVSVAISAARTVLFLAVLFLFLFRGKRGEAAQLNCSAERNS